MRRLFMLALLLLLAAPVWAATRYASPTGSGSACTTITTPCSAATAISQAVAGDTVYFRGGVYTSALNWSSRAGTNGNPITYSGYPGETATLRAGVGLATFTNNTTVQDLVFQQLTIDGSTQGSQESGIFLWHNPFDENPTFAALRTRRILLQDLIITQWTGHGIQGYFAEDVIIRRVRVSNSGRGCPWPGGSTCRALQGIYGTMPRLIIEDSEFFNNQGYGIQIYNQFGASATDTVIRRNKIHGNLGDGGVVLGFGNNIQFYNNLVYNNTGGGIYPLAYGATNAKVYNNTFSGNGSAPVVETGGQGSATNTEIKNNIFFGNQQGLSDLGTGTSYGTNLCGSSGTGCTTVGNPGFASAAGGDYHIAAAGSPAVGAGVNLSSTFTTDAESAARPSSGNWTLGAYEFNTQPFTPLGTIAKYRFNEGSGTSAADSSGQDHSCTLSSPAWGPGITETFAFAPTGTQYCTATMPAGIRPTTQAGLATWFNMTTTPATGSILAAFPGDALIVYVQPDGAPRCQLYDGTSFHQATGSSSVLTGTNRHASCSYKSGDGIRLRVDNVQVAFLPLTGTLNYSLGGNFTVGRSSISNDFLTSARMNAAHAFDTEITAPMNTLLFNELVPSAGIISVAHMAWYAANAAQGQQLGVTDTDRSHPLNTPVGIRWAIHKSAPGSLTEYFRPYARVLSNTGAVVVDWTEITNSFGTLGVRYLQDSAISQGEATSVLLPLDGFTGIAGKILENPIDTTSPYDAIQRITLNQGQHVELEIRIEFGPPLVPGQQVEIRPQRENGSPFDSYADKIYSLQFPGVDVLLPQNFSPVIDAVSCLGEVPTDIRGVARPLGADCDIGAYEMPSPGLVAGRQGGTYAGGTLR